MSRSDSGSLRIGLAAIDITPPPGVGILMSSVQRRWAPCHRVRSHLFGRALVLQHANRRVVLLSLDLLGLGGAVVGGWAAFKRAIARESGSGIDPDDLIITCTHTHNAPESLGLTDSYRGLGFMAWRKALTLKLARLIRQGTAHLEGCTLELAATQLTGFSLQRRIPTAQGIVLSDQFQPVPRSWLKRQPVDHRVRVLRFRNRAGLVRATITHAVCHPVHEMCLPQISADFPGELCAALEADGRQGMPLFLNGAAADINPPTVSEGEGAARRHGLALAAATRRARPVRRAVAPNTLLKESSQITLETRRFDGTSSRRNCRARIQVLAASPMALVFLPGEIFVETARAIEEQSPFPFTLVVGYAENTVGYVPTPKVLQTGGYEAGPGRWSFLAASAEPALRRAAIGLLQRLAFQRER